MKNDENSLYFWLGSEADIEESSEEEFNEKQEELRKNLDDWINVRNL